MWAWKNNNTIDTKVIRETNETNKYFFNNNNAKNSFLLPDYDAKNGIKQYWIGQDGKPFAGDIFKEYQHAGNFKNKENREEDDDDAYFKMCYCYLTAGFSFVFNMNIDDENVIDRLVAEKRIVYVGGERSKFICEIERLSESNPRQITNETYLNAYSHYADASYTKVILTSDAYTQGNPYESTLLAISKIKKFRFMQSCVNTTDAYNNRIQNSKIQRDGLKQSKLFNLLQRGSVFYFDKEANIGSFLNNIPFETIGYNKYYKF
jgi:hypothetical protein